MAAPDCEYCGGYWPADDLPPFFDLPPPPLPPFMQQQSEEFCSGNSLTDSLDTCQALLLGDAEYQVPLDSPPSLAVIVISAVLLTVVISMATLLFWRYRKQRAHQKVMLRCQQKANNMSGGIGGGLMDGSLPALLQGLQGNGTGRQRGVNQPEDDETVFYDELISYPTHYRTPHPTHPPAYEMKDVMFKSSPCHCTAHPLLGHRNVSNGTQHQQHYVTSPYHCSGSGSGSGNSAPPSSSTPTTDERPDSGSWIAEPVYEELPSGPEEDIHTPRDYRYGQQRSRNGSFNTNDSLYRGGHRGGSSVRGTYSNNWSGGEEAVETDFFLAPTTWYQQKNSLRGQLTTQGPVGRGQGGVRAAWREMEPANTERGSRKKVKRKSKSFRAPESDVGSVPVQQGNSLYRGRCPPEDPPLFLSGEEQLDPLAPLDNTPPSPAAEVTTPTKTLPRYYYYSESDDYGVSNHQRSLYGGSRRGQQQRPLSRAQRTAQRSPTSDVTA